MCYRRPGFHDFPSAAEKCHRLPGSPTVARDPAFVWQRRILRGELDFANCRLAHSWLDERVEAIGQTIQFTENCDFRSGSSTAVPTRSALSGQPRTADLQEDRHLGPCGARSCREQMQQNGRGSGRDARFIARLPQSGRAEARTGPRMMPTSPRPSLSFRTAGFPRYGWKAPFSRFS